MKYLAILGYDCGCFNDANYGFMKPIRFNAMSEGVLEKKLRRLVHRKSKSSDGYQCHRLSPREILIFDEEHHLVNNWKRD